MGAYNNRPSTPISLVSQTVTNSAVPITAAALVHTSGLDATRARIVVSGDAIRYTVDGTTPTAAIGILIPVSTTFEIEGIDTLRKFRMIRVTTDATVQTTTFLA